jgi:hypothetical protein
VSTSSARRARERIAIVSRIVCMVYFEKGRPI